MPQSRKFYFRGYEIHSLGRWLSDLHNYEFNFSYRCVGEEKKIMTNGHVLIIFVLP